MQIRYIQGSEGGGQGFVLPVASYPATLQGYICKVSKTRAKGLLDVIITVFILEAEYVCKVKATFRCHVLRRPINSP